MGMDSAAATATIPATLAALAEMARLPIYRQRWATLVAARRIIAEQERELASLRGDGAGGGTTGGWTPPPPKVFGGACQGVVHDYSEQGDAGAKS